MSKKDLLERVTRSPNDRSGLARRDDAGDRPRPDQVQTRVSRKVVRRRRQDEPEPPPKPTRRVAADIPVARVDAPVEDSERSVGEAPAPAVEAAPVADVAPEPVEAKPARAAKPVAAEPQAAAPEPPPEAAPAAAAPEPAPQPAPVAPAPSVEPAVPAQEPMAAAPVAGGGSEESPKYAGLGKAVVMPPPGYDPSNPLAYRRRQEAEAAAAPAAAAAAAAAAAKRKGRREVRPDDRAGRRAAPAAGPADRGPAGRAPSGGGGGGPGGRYDRRPRRTKRRRAAGPKQASPLPAAHKRKVRVDHVISVGQLAHELGVKASVVIRALIDMGEMASITDMLDIDTATLVATEFDYEVENVGFIEEDYLETTTPDEDEQLVNRPPVVTIMGHVDHGKTTLLDAIRSSRVAAGESGGITQHIGAYQVNTAHGVITFLDTPGHEAFTAMRARGAGVTDIVILVVAADDGVQPQTVEAIHHAKAAGVPIIVAINKMDKPGVTADSIKSRLGEHGLVPEDWGGDTMMVPVSALKGEGLDALLEGVLLTSEVLDLKANPERSGEGTVIEAKMERGKGALATVLVQRGTLTIGDYVVLGSSFGRVRAMLDDQGKTLKSAGPSTPVELFGLSELPSVGDPMNAVANEKNARKLADHRGEAKRLEAMANTRRKTAEDLFAAAQEVERETLLMILKTDVQGSLEALRGALDKIEFAGTECRILHAAVGPISESDVNLAASDGAILVGFNVKADAKARAAAAQQGVEVESYTVIYDLIDRVERELKGLMAPVFEEIRQGTLEVRALFRISKIGVVAGCYVIDGKAGRNHIAKVLRDGAVIWEGEVDTLKRFKDDVKEVGTGYECGMSLVGFNDLVEGDLIETYARVQVEPT